jgi:hypothetical protein
MPLTSGRPPTPAANTSRGQRTADLHRSTCGQAIHRSECALRPIERCFEQSRSWRCGCATNGIKAKLAKAGGWTRVTKPSVELARGEIALENGSHGVTPDDTPHSDASKTL